MTFIFKELAGSPVEIFQPDGMKAERRLLCSYEDRYALVAALLGGSEIGGRPQAFYPNNPDVLAMRVRVEPFEKRPDNQGTFDDLTADLNSYCGQFVEVIVNYELLDYDDGSRKLPKPPDSTFLTYRMDFGGEYVTIPGDTLRWDTDSTIPVTPESVPTMRIPITEHQITWHRVANPPWDAIRASIGAVNDRLFMDAASETVMLDGVKADRQFSSLDNLRQPEFGWRLTFVFREKTIKVLSDDQQQITYGWNHSYRADGSRWERLTDRNGNGLYRKVNLGLLFQYPA